MDSAKIVDSKPRLAGWAFLDQPVRKRSEPAGRGFVRMRTRACFSYLNPRRCARKGLQGYLTLQAHQIRKVATIPAIGVGGVREPEFADNLQDMHD